MRRPQFDMQMFKDRRTELAKRAQGSAIILPSHPEMIRNNDVHHRYRPDNNLFYLTGWEEPESIFVFRPGFNPETILFVRKKDPLRETWDGFRYGPEAAAREFGIDKTYLIDEFNDQIVDLLKPVDRLYYRFNVDREMDLQILGTLEKWRTSLGRTGRGYLPIYDSWELLGEMRVKKNETEMKAIRKACEISADAHLEVMKKIKPGMNERQVHGIFVGYSYQRGSPREGYNSIVASGAAATTLHYVFNDQPCNAGDLLLIDAGAEYDYYTGDITRTFPVNGRFTDPQRRVYQRVLDVQKAIIGMVRPGLPFARLQESAIELMTDVMIELKLLQGNRKALIDAMEFKRYYPHGIGHYLGLDVHDSGLYLKNGEPRPIEPGMVFTVEPGIYIPADDMKAPAELRGIGVRIEDNIYVTETGYEILTARAPKEISEVEALVGTAPSI